MSRQSRELSVGQRADGTPWRIPVYEFTAGVPGPVTAFNAGLFGDKILSCLAVHQLMDRLDELGSRLAGTVYCIPAANPFGLEAGTRRNPDHQFSNRRFPGAPEGSLSDQIAHAVFGALTEHADCIVDIHSGTPEVLLNYIYNFGDLPLSSSFGYLPILESYPQEGQLTLAAVRAGRSAVIPQFGGAHQSDPTVGVEGCLNLLRYRGHLDGEYTGPPTVPLIGKVDIGLASTTGILRLKYDLTHVGRTIPAGPFAWVLDPATGEPIEEFVCHEDGAVYLGAKVTPVQVSAGDYAYAIGTVTRQVEVGVG